MSDAMREAFENHADQYDNFGDEWQDMGVDQHFYAGWQAALEHAGRGVEPVAYCFTDVNGRPKEFCSGPETLAPEDKRIITALYTQPPALAVPKGFVLWPEQLTYEMVRAFSLKVGGEWDEVPENQKFYTAEKLQSAFDAMLNAAPKAPDQ